MRRRPRRDAPKGPPSPMASARMKPGMLYGANDNRRPAGEAAGY